MRPALFNPFSFLWVDDNDNLLIKLFNHIIIYNIYNNICNGLGHNQHTHIHLSEILYLSDLYHHSNILLFGSNFFKPQSIIELYNIQVTNVLAHFFRKLGLIFYTATHVRLSKVLVSNFALTFLKYRYLQSLKPTSQPYISLYYIIMVIYSLILLYIFTKLMQFLSGLRTSYVCYYFVL